MPALARRREEAEAAAIAFAAAANASAAAEEEEEEEVGFDLGPKEATSKSHGVVGSLMESILPRLLPPPPLPPL